MFTTRLAKLVQFFLHFLDYNFVELCFGRYTIIECRMTSFHYAAGVTKYLKTSQKYMFGRRSEPQVRRKSI